MRLWLATLAFLLAGCATTPSTSPLPVVRGKYEPGYKYPWVVTVDASCGGVLLSPRWVLTAAHCIGDANIKVNLERTDPSGQKHSQERFAVGGTTNIFVHPAYQLSAAPANDIALLRLSAPFDIAPHALTVGLPTARRQAGITGTLASFSHTAPPLAPGEVAVFRAPIPAGQAADVFAIFSTPTSGSLCKGDSGSGFVTVENGRAVVRGVTSTVTINDCEESAGFRIDFVDVFHHRQWILDTMQVTDHFLVGNTRVRPSGEATRGIMMLGCDDIYGTPVSLVGPLYVRGVELGLNCADNLQQSVICSVQGADDPSRIVKFTRRSMLSDGSTIVEELPFGAKTAAHYSIRPKGSIREFDCRILSRDVIIDDGVGELEPR